MSRFKLLLLGFLAACSLSAFATSSASAAGGECGPETGLFIFCDHTGRELTNTLLLGLSLNSILEGKAGGAALIVECPDAHLDLTILSLGGARGSILYLGCLVSKPTGCGVEKTIRAEFNDSLVGSMGHPLDLFTGAKAEEEFVTLTITTCTVQGTYKVKGSQLVEHPEGEASSAEHLVIAKKSGSKLKFGVEPASYSGITHNLRLESGLAWLIMLGT